MSDASEVRMNVAALKRVDPYVKEILETATHVALYTFNGETSEWEKTEIEGALFVYSRIGEPYHSILIMNRLNTKNQVEPVTAGLDLQLQEPFLLYKNAKGSIYGIWFYGKDDCVRISNILNKLVKESDANTKSMPKNKKTVQKKTNNVDIFSMLSKAQEDFNSNKSIPSKTGGVRSNMVSKSPMSNAIGELSGALNAMAMQPDVTSKSVMDFFAKAKVNTGQFKPGDQPQTGNIVSNEGKPFLQRFMSHPAAHTLEHIEKQQRSVTPQMNLPPQTQMLTMNNQSNERIMNSITSKIKNKIQTNTNQAENNYSLNSTTCTMMMCSEVPTANNINERDTNTGFLRVQSPNTINTKNFLNQKKNKSVSSGFPDVYDSLNKESNDSVVSNNSLVFDSTLYQHNSTNVVCDELLSPKQSSSITSGSAPALIPPVMFAAPSPAVAEPLQRPLEPLTRNQLLQAFNYLLRNDPEFINKLHEAYVKSFSEIIS